MDSHSLSRAGKHVSRFFSKPFVGANKDNLKELEKILRKVTNVDAKEPFAGITLRQGRFDFTWLTFLKRDELARLQGDWVACFQTSKRGMGASGMVHASVLTLTDRETMLNGSNDAFWKSLQQTKDTYRALAGSNVDGFFSNAKRWVTTKTTEASDAIHHTAFIGEYATLYETVNFAFDDATMRGAQTDTDRQILAAGGVWRMLKSAGTLAKEIVTLAVPTPGKIKSIIQSGVGVLNHLGGLVAGLGDIVQGREADFRKLSARYGLDQHISMLKQKYLGPGVIEEGDTLHQQMLDGTHRLETAARITLVDLDNFRTNLKHSLWWCENWKKDIAEMRQDVLRHDYVDELNHAFGLLANPDGCIKPSKVAELRSFVLKDKEKIGKQIDELEKKVKRFELVLGDRVKKLNTLLAAYDTRKSLAAVQSKTAAIRTRTGGHLAYDTMRTIAHQAAAFDRTKLRSAATPHPSQKPPKEEPSDGQVKLQSLLATALADRRAYVEPDPPEEDDGSDW